MARRASESKNMYMMEPPAVLVFTRYSMSARRNSKDLKFHPGTVGISSVFLATTTRLDSFSMLISFLIFSRGIQICPWSTVPTEVFMTCVIWTSRASNVPLASRHLTVIQSPNLRPVLSAIRVPMRAGISSPFWIRNLEGRLTTDC